MKPTDPLVHIAGSNLAVVAFCGAKLQDAKGEIVEHYMKLDQYLRHWFMKKAEHPAGMPHFCLLCKTAADAGP